MSGRGAGRETLAQLWGFRGPDLHSLCFALPLNQLGGGVSKAQGRELPPFIFTFHLVLILFSFFKGLNPGKAIAEIKKMMATYKEKKASA